jgi:hypothetical protein
MKLEFVVCASIRGSGSIVGKDVRRTQIYSTVCALFLAHVNRLCGETSAAIWKKLA